MNKTCLKNLIKKINSFELNEVIEYVVFKEHTLGYLFKDRLGNLNLGVLHGKVMRGGYNDLDGPVAINESDLKFVKFATKKDFEFYRVLPKGFDLRD
ncbi:MAG: hypothetical protein KC589_04555 [Nanoarchaeota archaeon]|nr:hypothetical protein [Nanoarchaeota archaeon]